MSKMIAIEGVMGVGKSTLLERLKKEIVISSVEQDFEHNICLTDFYKGWDCAFQKQMIFLFSNYHILSKAEKDYSCFLSDFCFERSIVMSRNILKDKELLLYEQNYSYLKEKLNSKKMIIFLYGDTKKIINNINKRGRTNERNISREYIDICQNTLISNLNKFEAQQIVDININNVNITSDECINYLVSEIMQFLL